MRRDGEHGKDSIAAELALGTEFTYRSGAPHALVLGALHSSRTTVNEKVIYGPEISTRDLPVSLCYASKPAWWPAGADWPWTGPDLAPMVGTLAAQATSARFDYQTNNNPKCTPNVGNYSCP